MREKSEVRGDTSQSEHIPWRLRRREVEAEEGDEELDDI